MAPRTQRRALLSAALTSYDREKVTESTWASAQAFWLKKMAEEAETKRFRDDANTLDGAAFEARYGIAPGYMTGSNRYFEVIGRVPARWNRMVLHDGAVWHGAGAAQRCDLALPRVGAAHGASNPGDRGAFVGLQ